MPLIGKKNAKQIDISVNSSDCIDISNSDSCAFIFSLQFQILVKK
jgi:hypothetical protein